MNRKQKLRIKQASDNAYERFSMKETGDFQKPIKQAKTMTNQGGGKVVIGVK